MFDDLNAAAREAVRRPGCPRPVGRLDPDDFIWTLDAGNAATQAIRGQQPRHCSLMLPPRSRRWPTRTGPDVGSQSRRSVLG